VRLRIDTGSLNEADDQRGLAHFLEHMVLNGTEKVPEGDFVRRLERAGLRFGP
jgi:zinc protease